MPNFVQIDFMNIIGHYDVTDSNVVKNNSYESSTNELPLSEINFSKNPSTPVTMLREPRDFAATNLDSLNFENNHRMSPLATNELPLSCTRLTVPNSDSSSGSSLPDEHLLALNELSHSDRIRRNSCSLDYRQSSSNALNYSRQIDGNNIKVL